MNHLVLKKFIDKESGDYFETGSFYISENIERVKELEEKGLIKANENISTLALQSSEENESEEDEQKNDFEKPSLADLRKVAKELDIKGRSNMDYDELEAAIQDSKESE